jgi:membrane protein
MAENSKLRLEHLKHEAENLLREEDAWRLAEKQSPGRRFLHFWVMVFRHFIRNRCLIRASALAYTTMLALVPMLAVGASVAVSLLKKQGEKPIRELIDKVVAYAAPALDLQVKTDGIDGGFGRERVVSEITNYIQNISSGAIGVTGMIALILAAIQMLRTIELTFNDIWGVTRRRPIAVSVVQYWAVITLGPLILVLALGMTSSPYLAKTMSILNQWPLLSAFLFSLMPFFLLSFGFSLFYQFMPNTQVQFSAAVIGGFTAGFLWELNSLLNTLYASKVVTYSKIYGGLGMVPIFLLGIYFSWVFLLFGAQVAYAYQNREAYLQEKQAGAVNQAGREFVALRLMTFLGIRFQQGEPPPSPAQISKAVGVPTRLATQILAQLAQAGLVVETIGKQPGFSPARPLDKISCADIINVLRTSGGFVPETAPDPVRQVVRGGLEKIQRAEQTVAAETTLLSLVTAALQQAQAGDTSTAQQAQKC